MTDSLREKIQHSRRALVVLVVAAAVVRLLLAAKTAGYPYDTTTFFAWAWRMAEVGPAGFYSPDYFADYPPGYMLVLWAVGGAVRLLGLSAQSAAARVLLCLVPIAADLALGVFAYMLGRKALGEKGALLLAGLLLLNPMLIFDCAVWKQVDAVLTLLLAFCFYALSKKMYLTAGIFYALALLVKPQALLFGPVFALCYALPFIFPGHPGRRAKLAGGTLAAFALCMAVLAGGSLFFQGGQTPFVWLIQKYTTTAVSYPYASLNAFNLMALLGGNWARDDVVFLFLTWKQWGTVGIVLATAALLWFAAASWRRGTFCPWLLAGFYCCAIFTLAHNMHERYLVPGVVFLFFAFAVQRDRRILWAAVLQSATCLADMATVYCNVGGDEFLSGAPMQLLVRLLSACQVAVFAYLAVTVFSMSVKGRIRPAAGFYHCPADYDAIGRQKAEAFGRIDVIFLAAVTLASSLLSFTYLGDVRVPESAAAADAQKSCTITFDGGFDLYELFVYPGIGTGTVTVSTDKGSLTAELGVYTSWTWTSARAEDTGVPISAGEPVTVTLSQGVTVNELALRDAAGNLHEPRVTQDDGLSALFDEQELVPARATQLNSMYFDEVYHGRTAYEFLHRLPVYETTHPPLGKDLIALGVALFGMCPFGWRFAGTLFGVLMLPVLYLLAKELLYKRSWAGFVTLLFALDCMRFVQTRIATIDVFVVFFILLSSLFMLKACRIMVCGGVRRALLPIALGGAAFGCACAAKWTGVYAGAGLAVLYFGALWARRQRLAAEKPEHAKELFRRDLLRALAAGALFWAAVPLLIYLLSYLPYFVRDPGFGLAQWWQCQVSMFDYHSTLTATHPFQSSWFSWPFIWRPVWYYMGTCLPAGSYASIAVLGNPVLWLGGLAAMAVLAVRAVKGRQGAGGGFLLISYAAQLAPWVLVTRAVFLYHYFACVPFLALAMGYVLSDRERRHGRDLKKLRIGILAAAAAVFVFFYPAMSGLPVQGWQAQAMEWLPSWGFYIL